MILTSKKQYTFLAVCDDDPFLTAIVLPNFHDDALAILFSFQFNSAYLQLQLELHPVLPKHVELLSIYRPPSFGWTVVVRAACVHNKYYSFS
jgi:hypothetical protein